MTVHWQDLVFAAGGIFFIAAMLGSILSKTQKPPIISCAVTAFWLWLFVGVYLSYDLWFSVSTGILSATGWTILIFQRRICAGLKQNT